MNHKGASRHGGSPLLPPRGLRLAPGFIAGMSRLLSTHPRIGAAMRGAFYEIMFAPGAMDRADRRAAAEGSLSP